VLEAASVSAATDRNVAGMVDRPRRPIGAREVTEMPHYLLQAAYTPEAWATMTKNPQDRSADVGPVIEALGGRLESSYVSFGEYDAVVIAEFPDNDTAASFAMRAAAGGHLKALKTTPLLTAQQAVEAMARGGSLDYPVPG
jgi:uncharacterized protein with GYD domain